MVKTAAMGGELGALASAATCGNRSRAAYALPTPTGGSTATAPRNRILWSLGVFSPSPNWGVDSQRAFGARWPRLRLGPTNGARPKFESGCAL